MALDFEKLATDFNIPVFTEGYKQCRPGWVQLPCPFCGGVTHLGWNENDDYFMCWMCKWHPHIEVIAQSLKCSKSRAREILLRYGWRSKGGRCKISAPIERVQRRSQCKLPPGTVDLQPLHWDYLASRGYDPQELQHHWHLKGTKHLGPYKFRVIAPIYFEKKIVSFQGRDITGKSPLPYKACAKDHEARDHKRCLYGYDEAPGQDCVITEGITDVWRLGPGAVNTFGIAYTMEQVRLLRKRFRRKFILYDEADSQAMDAARALAAMLDDCEIITGTGVDDPAKLPQDDANSLMRELGVSGNR